MTLACNQGAVELAREFSTDPSRHIVIVGPSGWGKTTLLEATARALCETTGRGVFVVPATRWVESKALVGDIGPVVVDDAQDATKNPRSTHKLRQALESRLRLHRPTLLSFTVAPGHRMRPPLWLASREWTVGTMGEPEGPEREAVVRSLARAEGVLLGPAVVRLIARHLRGNGRSVRGALQRLTLVKHNWTGVEDACRACGVLMPYLIGENGWDPRDEVHDAVSQTLADWGRPTKRSVSDVCAYILLHEVGLSEREVASFLDVQPARAFAMASAVAKRMGEGRPSASVQACKNAVFDRFCAE
ncbi:MAG: hypothetical protein KF857_04755 [Fimbriimonadaceae bacterium]|nr:hypothetical protein [Fimbriimonadaceae bacterium]